MWVPTADSDLAIAVDQACKLGQQACQPLDLSGLELKLQLEVCVQVDRSPVDDVPGTICKLERGAGLLKG